MLPQAESQEGGTGAPTAAPMLSQNPPTEGVSSGRPGPQDLELRGTGGAM